jgi:hypothetical protein
MNETILQIQDRLAAGVALITERLPAILANPRAYPREAMLLAAIAALAVLMIVLLVVVVFDITSAARARRKLGVKRRSRTVPLFIAVGVAGLMLLVLVMLPNTVIVSQQCDACHQISEPVTAWENDVHAAVACYSCHSSGGVAGSVQASTREIRRVFAPEGVRATAHVYDTRCLDCHENISDGIVGAAVKMRHSDVIDAGYACADCHLEVGHAGLAAMRGEDLSDRRSVMTVCMSCHDGEQVSADCEMCHDGRPSDPPDAVPAGDTPTPIQCDGCHTPETDASCIDCHGLELPHPVGFMQQHAGLSWNDPALCARCHEQARPQNGCDCHGDVNLHGTYEEWFPKHGPAARDQWPGGCNCHEVAYCAKCHTTSPF